MTAIVNLLFHLSSSLDKFADALPDAFQIRDPKLLHAPIKAIVIIETLHNTLHHELKSPTCDEFLHLLTTDFGNILLTLKDGLAYCIMGGPEPIYISLEEYQQNIRILVNKAKETIKTHLDPILKKMHEDAEKEHGEPMCFAIGAYRPWDAAPEPESEFMRMLRGYDGSYTWLKACNIPY